MFTGLIEATGTVTEVHRVKGGIELTIEAPFDDLTLGESVAVDGACLTVAAMANGTFGVHVVVTSLDRTNFGSAAAGRQVNLERALRVGDRLGGHMVQGHVDGIGTVRSVAQRDDVTLIDISVPVAVADVSMPLGSVTVDGVSLTINAIPASDVIQCALIPFTLQHTTLGARRPGDTVHLEGDMVGKYLRQLVANRPESGVGS